MSRQSNTGEMVRAKTSLPSDVDGAIEDRLEYGDSKSGWIRQACIEKLEKAEKECDDLTDK